MADWADAATGTPASSVPLPLPHEGYIHKRGHKVHNWKKRYAIFDAESQTLSYYSDNPNVDPSGKRSGSGLGGTAAGAVPPKGRIKVQTFETKEMRTGLTKSVVQKYGIAINTTDLELYVQTEEQQQQWMTALKHAHDYHLARSGNTTAPKFASAEAHAKFLRPAGRPRGETTVLETFQQGLVLIQKSVSIARSHLQLLGGASDSVQLRQHMAQERTNLRQRIAMADGILAQMKDNPNMSRADWQKLRRDLDGMKTEAGAVIKQAEEKLTRYPVAAGGSVASTKAASAAANLAASGQSGFGGCGGGGGGGGEDQMTQDLEQQILQKFVVQDDVDINEELIEQREKGINKIVQEIAEVNELFKDVAQLVNEQQIDINTVEANVEGTLASAQEGLEQLKQADKIQGNCLIC